MTAKDLASICARYERAYQQYEKARQARYEAILQALTGGMRPVEVARITGVSRARIAQITQPERTTDVS